MSVSFDFKDQHVVVFGGTTGINLGIACAFAKAGARVCVASRKQENVDAAVATLEALGAQALGLVADVRDDDSVAAAMALAHARFGDIDVLVSGAAGNFMAEVNDLSSNAFKVVVDIDLNGTFHVARRGYPYLKKPGASIINISAPQSVVPMRYQAHVCAAKAGVDQLTRVLALEWGAAGVRVNAISPGAIDGTEGMRRLSPQSERGQAMVRSMVPLGRLGTTDDIAQLAMFLSSPAASYITGTVIACDGGGAMDSVKPMLEAAAQQMKAEKAKTAQTAEG